MKDEDKTKEQLLRELRKTHKRITELETLVTELREMGEKRAVALKMAADMIENIPAGVVITDIEGKIIDINRALTEKTGYTKEDLIGKTPLEMGIGKDELVKVMDALIKLFSGESVIGTEYRVIRKDGSGFPATVDISVLKDTDGNPISGIVVLKDITKRGWIDHQLAERELTILRLIANGTTTREIAAQFSLSEATIKRDVRNIMEKFSVRNRSEAVAEAYKRNLV
jgi:PAS domain S-box-containing protein